MKRTDADPEREAAARSSGGNEPDQQRAAGDAGGSPVDSLHRAVGNQAVQASAGRGEGPTSEMCPRCASRYRAGLPLHCAECEPGDDGADARSSVAAAVQRSLATGTGADAHERQAERVADAAVRAPAPADGVARGAPAGDGAPSGAPGGATLDADGAVARAVEQAGRPLSPSLRSYFEPRLGGDLGHVRVHTGTKADSAARAVNARALTYGRDVVFRAGEFRPESRGGRRLLAHELTHVLQQAGPAVDGVSQVDRPRVQRQPAATLCYREDEDEPGRPGPGAHACRARRPADCPTYGQWLNRFVRQRRFRGHDTAPGAERAGAGFTILGEQGDRPVDVVERSEMSEREKREALLEGETRGKFVHRPTDRWVRTCLPENLRETAYELPADCADMAFILRHVYLSAHGRTERYDGPGRGNVWEAGDLSGASDIRRRISTGPPERWSEERRERWGRILYSGNVEQMVDAYETRSGDRIRTFEELQDRLHPGDVLVWEHLQLDPESGEYERTGGHTQTIVDVEREETREGGRGDVTGLTFAQGNLPIFRSEAEQIRSYLTAEGHGEGDDLPTVRNLRNTPGRRIELSTMGPRKFTDEPVPEGAEGSGDVWTIDDPEAEDEPDKRTILLAAGPPKAASRPAAGREGGRRVQRLSDWNRSLRSASLRNLPGVLEAALLEARSAIEGTEGELSDDVVTNAVALGRVAGDRLWSLARPRRGVDYADHYEALRRMRGLIRGIGNPHRDPAYTSHETPRAGAVARVFDRVDVVFGRAARGTHQFAGGSSAAATVDVADWVRRVQSASLLELPGVVEAALLNVKSAVEAGTDEFDTDPATISFEAGKRLWELARSAGGLGDRTHFRPLLEIRGIIDDVGGPYPTGADVPDPSSAAARVAEVFYRIESSFELAARGVHDVSFDHGESPDRRTIRVLVTGFDPFAGGSGQQVPEGYVNPSAAAALALDGTTIRGETVDVAVESVVLPVDYAQFQGGIVEGIVDRHLDDEDIDAVITTSLAPGIAPDDPLQIERYAVGVHYRADAMETVAPSPGPLSTDTGVVGPVLEAQGDVDAVERAVDPSDTPEGEEGAVKVDPETVLRFDSARAAERAAAAIPGATAKGRRLTIASAKGVGKILESLSWGDYGNDPSVPPALAHHLTERRPRVTFEIKTGGQRQQFTAEVLRGPGGNFLSNEVSYRVLRALQREGRTDVTSFHVHLPRVLAQGSRIPQGSEGARRRKRREAERNVRENILETLRKMLAAVGEQHAGGSGSDSGR
jgi:pyrrolidone-carboxylate peptidase